MSNTPALTAEYKKVITSRYNKTCYTCGGNVVADQDFAALNISTWYSYCAKCASSFAAQVAGLVQRIETATAPLGDNVPVDVLAAVLAVQPTVESILAGTNTVSVVAAAKRDLFVILGLVEAATATPDPLIDALRAIAATNDRDSNFARSLLQGHAKYGSLTGPQRSAAERMVSERARKAVTAHQAPAYAPLPVAEVGLYRSDDGTIRRVYNTGRGRLGCRKYNGRNFHREGTVGVRLVADGLAAGTVRLLTAVEASAFGKQIGRCFNCMSIGRPGHLSDDRSLSVGYGPDCAANNNWWYPTNDEAARILRGDLDLDQKLTQGLPLAPAPSESEVASVVEALEAGDTLEGAELDDADLYIDEEDDVDVGCPSCGRVTGFDGNGAVVCDNCGWRVDEELVEGLDAEQAIVDRLAHVLDAQDIEEDLCDIGPAPKAARDLVVGDYIEGLGTITIINTTTTPGVVYVWVNNRSTVNPADAAYHHGERVKVTEQFVPLTPAQVEVTERTVAAIDAEIERQAAARTEAFAEAAVATSEAPVCSCCGNEPGTLSFVCQDGEAHKVCPPCRVMLVRRPTCPFHE